MTTTLSRDFKVNNLHTVLEAITAFSKLFFLNWGSLHARLKKHYKALRYRRKEEYTD